MARRNDPFWRFAHNYINALNNHKNINNSTNLSVETFPACVSLHKYWSPDHDDYRIYYCIMMKRVDNNMWRLVENEYYLGDNQDDVISAIDRRNELNDRWGPMGFEFKIMPMELNNLINIQFSSVENYNRDLAIYNNTKG